MKAYEIETRVTKDGTLEIPQTVLQYLPPGQKLRAIILVPGQVQSTMYTLAPKSSDSNSENTVVDSVLEEEPEHNATEKFQGKVKELTQEWGSEKQDDKEYSKHATISMVNKTGQLDSKKYQILRELDRGGMGITWLAQETTNPDRKVVIKDIESKEAIDLERFKREIRLHAKLRHPNIVRIIDAGIHANTQKPYLVMEYVEGRNLAEIIIRKKKLEFIPVLHIAIAVSQALQHAQASQIIHRDIKPANIIISKDGEVKLLDFGLAKGLLESEELTETGEIWGTPNYLSPEHIQDFKKADHRSDIYSLGATLYHLLSGNPPYGEIVSSASIIIAIMENPLPPIDLLRPDVPAKLKDVLIKMMDKNLQKRYQEFQPLINDLVDVLAELDKQEMAK